ncbi:MAG: heterodisulfide reductase-related iron-sulfur binding cluster [Candidatus Nanopelagicales bacterium]|nr:heterodisulfide reductase-related iron-sulfur binding cluster [Candidatus Nanopelagicales bacterium]
MVLRLVVGLALTFGILAFAGRRMAFLVKLARSGKPAVGRLTDPTARVEAEAVEVLGQKKLLKWTIPGIAHVFAFWGFLVLGATILEVYGALFIPDFAIPVVGHWSLVGFLEDLFGLLVLVGITIFAILRLRNNPEVKGRWSRFFGSHTSGAWIILFMIFNVVWTLFLYRAAQYNTGVFPFMDGGAFVTEIVAGWLEPLGETANEWLETIGIWLQIAVVLLFLLIVLHSKHLHIGAAPINVFTSRRPDALGPLLPMMYNGEPLNFEDPPEDALFGKGHIAEFTWKGYVDFMACTECGRCQSQCPAWNTEKPLSPKLMIMNLRDTMFAQSDYLLAAKGKHPGLGEFDEAALNSLSPEVRAEVERPFIGSREGSDHSAEDGYTFDGHRTTGADLPIIDEEALWNCTTCGACVNQCPVDIEHIDHFIDMRRNQVMIASDFPSELNGLFKNLENKGNPWGMNASDRNAWIEEVDFEVAVFGANGEDTIPADVDYLFWVGCAGAFEDRAKRTTKNVAELMNIAGVKFMVLGEGETCTGDPARRAGNEFLFQMQAAQNVEVLNEIKATKIVVTCPHCLNTLKREYPQLGGNYEVVHHTELLNDLVKAGRLTPVNKIDKTVTYHDPCYLGRHNKVYVPPRELVKATADTTVEMERSGDRSFCCGAGGARMWMEEKIGTRINQNRGDEAIATGAKRIAVACPFCSVMLNDAVTSRQQEEGRAVGVEVVDVSTLLLNATKA